MPKSDHASSFSYTTESDSLLSRYHNKIAGLEYAIRSDEEKIFRLNESIPQRKIRTQELTSQIKKLKQDYSGKKNSFKNQKNFHNFIGILRLFFFIFFRIAQRSIGIMIIHIQEHRLGWSIKAHQNHQRELGITRSEISVIYSQRQNGFELFKENWLPVDEIRVIREGEIGISDNFSSMSPRDFELFTAELLKEMDYKIIQVTPEKGDYGTDIVVSQSGKTIAVQCKRYNENNVVGNREIQQLLGSMRYYNASHAIFITTSFYTPQAMEQTKNASIELWDKDTLHGNVRKYLLKKDIPQIFDAIKNAKRKDEVKKTEARFRAEEKKERERDKSICPICGGKKQKSRKMCYRCKEERRKERRRDRYDDGYPSYDWGPTQSFDLDWNDFNRRF